MANPSTLHAFDPRLSRSPAMLTLLELSMAVALAKMLPFRGDFSIPERQSPGVGW